MAWPTIPGQVGKAMEEKRNWVHKEHRANQMKAVSRKYNATFQRKVWKASVVTRRQSPCGLCEEKKSHFRGKHELIEGGKEEKNANCTPRPATHRHSTGLVVHVVEGIEAIWVGKEGRWGLVFCVNLLVFQWE